MALTRSYDGQITDDATADHTLDSGALFGICFVHTYQPTTPDDVALSGAGGAWTRIDWIEDTDGDFYIGAFWRRSPSTGAQTLTIADGGTLITTEVYTYDTDIDDTAFDVQENAVSDGNGVDLSWTKAAADHILAANSSLSPISSRNITGTPTPTEEIDTDVGTTIGCCAGYYDGVTTSGSIGWDDGASTYHGQLCITIVENAAGGGTSGPLVNAGLTDTSLIGSRLVG